MKIYTYIRVKSMHCHCLRYIKFADSINLSGQLKFFVALKTSQKTPTVAPGNLTQRLIL